jgi:hypothetical protein
MLAHVRRAWIAIIACTACTGGGAPAASPAAVGSATAHGAAAHAAGSGAARGPAVPAVGTAAASDATRATPDDDFKALAKAVAAKMGGQLDGWGTAKIADDRREHRYAVVRNTNFDGGYLIEASPGQDWLIVFTDDGHTGAWMSQLLYGKSPPVWKEGDGKAVEHMGGHARGEELIDFRLEGGVPTALSYGYLGDAREGDELQTTDYTGKHKNLGDLETHESDLRVVGPAADAEQLTRNIRPPSAVATPHADITPAPESHWRQLLAGPLGDGCIALDRAGEALCLTESGGIQTVTTINLTWLSANGAEVWHGADLQPRSFDDAHLDADTQARAVARLVAGGYGEMPAPTWTASLAPASAGVAKIADDAARVRIVWTRTAVGTTVLADGGWTRFRDVVKSQVPVACSLGVGTIENPDRSDMSVWQLPGGAVLVVRQTAWATEGDSGGDTVAQVLADGKPCPAR